MAMVVLLVANTSAFSRIMSSPPYTVDSEIRNYPERVEDAASGSDVRRTVIPQFWYMPLLVTSYNEAGSERILSASFPNHPLWSVVGKVFLGLWGAADTFQRRFGSPDDEAEAFAIVYPSSPRGDMGLVVGRRDELLTSDCRTSHGDAKVIGQDVILNYPVTVVQQPHSGGNQMVTLWMAPELSCFALRATIHAKQPDGTSKLISEKQAVKVTVNR
jgi:hypothetical protein